MATVQGCSPKVNEVLAFINEHMDIVSPILMKCATKNTKGYVLIFVNTNKPRLYEYTHVNTFFKKSPVDKVAELVIRKGVATMESNQLCIILRNLENEGLSSSFARITIEDPTSAE